MPKPPTRKGELIQQMCRDYPEERSTTIATWLYDRNPGVWPNVDAVRQSVRYYRGQKGRKARESRSKKEQFEHKLPKGRKKRPSTIKLPEGKWLILSDIHCPYHDERAIEAALKFGRDEGCDSLILNGDALDAYQVSQWLRDPRAEQIDTELTKLKELIKYISDGFERCAYKIGNHEARIESYLFSNAPRMPSMSRWKLTEELAEELELDDWIMIASKQLYKLGHLNGYHGHELPKGLTNPVSIGRGIWLRTSQSAFAGHWHKVDTYTQTSADKKKIWTCFGIGCLCDLQPDYAPINGWSQGCAIVENKSNGTYIIDNRRIHDGQVW